jgi:hypothetical protein
MNSFRLLTKNYLGKIIFYFNSIYKKQMNKKIKTEIALGIITLLAFVIGGIFWLSSVNVSKIPEDIAKNTLVQPNDSQITEPAVVYKLIDIKNPRIKFSFEVPNDWNVENRNSGEKQMTLDEKRDFLADVLNGDSEYADYTRADFNKMSAKEIEKFFGWEPVASVTELDSNISYSDWSHQIDFYILSDTEANRVVKEAQNSEDYEGIYYNKSGKPNKLGKPVVKKLKINNYDAISVMYPIDIDENGKELSSKAGTGGQDIYIYIEKVGKVLNIYKQTKGNDQFEGAFEHLLQTFKINI